MELAPASLAGLIQGHVRPGQQGMTKTARLLPKNLNDGRRMMEQTGSSLGFNGSHRFAGIYIGAAFNLEGYLGISFVSCNSGLFYYQAIEDKDTNK